MFHIRKKLKFDHLKSNQRKKINAIMNSYSDNSAYIKLYAISQHPKFYSSKWTEFFHNIRYQPHLHLCMHTCSHTYAHTNTIIHWKPRAEQVHGKCCLFLTAISGLPKRSPRRSRSCPCTEMQCRNNLDHRRPGWFKIHPQNCLSQSRHFH